MWEFSSTYSHLMISISISPSCDTDTSKPLHRGCISHVTHSNMIQYSIKHGDEKYRKQVRLWAHKTPHILPLTKVSLIARFMGPTWGLPGARRTQVRPMLVPWTLLSGICLSGYIANIVEQTDHTIMELLCISTGFQKAFISVSSMDSYRVLSLAIYSGVSL